MRHNCNKAKLFVFEIKDHMWVFVLENSNGGLPCGSCFLYVNRMEIMENYVSLFIHFHLTVLMKPF